MAEKYFSHLDAAGEVHMVDVSSKASTRRIAEAACLVITPTGPGDGELRVASSDVSASARLAGIHAAKRTADLIPLCHPLSLSQVQVDISVHARGYEVTSRVVTQGPTGVEMEALTACGFAALTLVNALVGDYPEVHVVDLVLLRKSGGKSGDWGREVPGNQ